MCDTHVTLNHHHPGKTKRTEQNLLRGSRKQAEAPRGTPALAPDWTEQMEVSALWYEIIYSAVMTSHHSEVTRGSAHEYDERDCF